MATNIDMSGQKFGRLTATVFVGRKHGQAVWECVCECGSVIRALSANLRKLHTRSCGCLHRDTAKARHASKRREPQDLGFGMHLVALSRGKSALIDSADAEAVGAYTWSAMKAKNGRWYAFRNDIENKRVVLMHREILNTAHGLDTDHINGDGLDNRRENLREATRSQNNCNARLRSDNTSGRKGVRWRGERSKWDARISVNGKYTLLGSFDRLEDAVAARDKAELELHGEFARKPPTAVKPIV